MFKVLKRASLIVAALAVTIVGSATVFAAANGGIESGSIYFAKNVTKGTGFSKTSAADKGETVQYRVRIHNPGPGVISGTTVKATIPSGVTNNANSTVTLNAINNSQGTVTDTTAVNLAGSYTVAYIPGSTELLDASAVKISTLPDTILSSGVNVGNVGVSLAEKRFVQFSVKINAPEVPKCPAGQIGTPPHCENPKCPAGQVGTPPHCEVPMCPAGTTGTPPKCVEPPKPSVVCDALKAEFIGSTNVPATLKFTAKATAKNGATITGYAFDFGDGVKEDSTAATTQHTYTKEDDYKATVQVKSSLGLTAISSSCTVKVKVTKEKPPVIEIPPVVTTEVPPTPTPSIPAELPSTGPVEVISGLFGTSSLGFGIRQWLMSRRRLSDSF